MSLVYAREEGTGRRFLERIECDAAGCEATLKPGPHVRDSGWIKCGITDSRGRSALEWDYCPEHTDLAPDPTPLDQL